MAQRVEPHQLHLVLNGSVTASICFFLPKAWLAFCIPLEIIYRMGGVDSPYKRFVFLFFPRKLPVLCYRMGVPTPPKFHKGGSMNILFQAMLSFSERHMRGVSGGDFQPLVSALPSSWEQPKRVLPKLGTRPPELHVICCRGADEQKHFFSPF